MIFIELYMQQLISSLKDEFGTKLLYVGLQGSYLRNEATSSSDIDVMVIIDELTVSDMDLYRSILQNGEYFDKSCGFICSSKDLKSWNPLEICHLLNSTKDYYGVLRNYCPAYTRQDVRNFTKLSINNLYHEICHRYIHAESNKSIEFLSASYKSVFFILQNWYYLMHGTFVTTKDELLSLLEGQNHAVLKRSIDLNNGVSFAFSESFELLFSWCQELLHALS